MLEAGVAFPVHGCLAPAAADVLGLAIFPCAAKGDVILMVLTDAGQVLTYLDAMSVQLVLGTDARLHQHFGSVDRTKRQDRFAGGAELSDFTVEHDSTPTALLPSNIRLETSAPVRTVRFGWCMAL